MIFLLFHINPLFSHAFLIITSFCLKLNSFKQLAPQQLNVGGHRGEEGGPKAPLDVSVHVPQLQPLAQQLFHESSHGGRVSLHSLWHAIDPHILSSGSAFHIHQLVLQFCLKFYKFSHHLLCFLDSFFVFPQFFPPLPPI